MRMQRPILLCHNCQTLCLCGFIALAQKSNTNIDIINHNILRGQAKAFQIITNNTGQEDEVLQHFNLPHGHHLNGDYLSI